MPSSRSAKMKSKHYYRVVRLNKRVIECHNLNSARLEGIAKNNSTNTAEAIDANLGSHFSLKVKIYVCFDIQQ